ncbi:MAG: PLP-dependent aminotransferase family protein [Butyrivibrio sp.]|nr:PLP-dependent aminotransferase family protein [Butyrivibrio sp.]
MLTYNLSNGEGPLYTRLYQHIKRDISNGTLTPGEKLPSRRTLAENMGVSTVTVDNAYGQLLEEGYIYALPKKGYFVSQISGSIPFPEVKGKKKSSSKLNFKKKNRNNITFDFSSNKPDADSFPFSVWAKLTREAVSGHSDELLKVSDYSGIYELRSAIAAHLSSFRGMSVDPDQIIVGAGTEYLYGLLIKLLGKDKKYCIENPGYKKISQIYETECVSYYLGSMDEYGLLVSELDRSGADIAHISPTHHFPTGITMPVPRRLELLSWASKDSSRYIIEDDYDSEFRHKGTPIPPLMTMDSFDKVIYINTFSKSLASTIRIAYMVLPPHLAQLFYDKLSFYSCTVSTFDQFTLASFIEKGYFEKHINRMRLQYGRKREQVLGIFEEVLGSESKSSGYKIVENDSGLHFILELKTRYKDAEIEKQLLSKSIKISAISDFYMDAFDAKLDAASQGKFIIDYSNMNIALLPDALKEIKKLLS